LTCQNIADWRRNLSLVGGGTRAFWVGKPSASDGSPSTTARLPHPGEWHVPIRGIARAVLSMYLYQKRAPQSGSGATPRRQCWHEAPAAPEQPEALREVLGASPAMEVTLSRKWARSQTRGLKRHLTGAKACVGRARQSRADLEQQLEACRREIAQTRERLIEVMKQQAATSEVLRIISDCPSEVQSVLDAVAENAARLCDANNARIWRLDDNLLRIVAAYGEISATSHGSEGLPVNRYTVTGRATCDRRTIHVHDLAAEDSDYPVGSKHVKDEGYRTTLATPLLREGNPIGIILVRRMEVRPFHDKQIALLETLAYQAVVAIENARLFEAEKQRTLALAHANRDLAEQEAKIRRPIEAQNPQAEDELRAIIDAAHHLENWQKSVSTGIPFETEARFRRPDGEYRWFLTRAEPLRDKTGRIVKWYGTNIDIENLKRTEERLRQSEAYLAEAQRLSHSGVAAYNETTTLYGSEEIYRIWGFDPAQGVPSREAVFQRIHPDDRDRLRAEVQRAVDEKRGYSTGYRIVLPDGTVKHLEAIGKPVFSARGELIEIVTTQIDVTERKRAEEALRESERKIRRLVDANILGICIWNLEGAIVEANEAFLHMLQYGREDVVSGRLRWTDLTPAEWRELDERAVAELRSTGTFQPFEKEYFRRDGSRVPVLIGGTLFEQSRNEGVAFVLDLTERKRAEDRLRRSEAYLAEAQRLSHTGNWVYDATTMHYLYWSDESYRIWGFDPLQGLPSRENMWQRIHPDDRDKVWEGVQEALRQKTNFASEFRILLPDGTVKFLEATSDHKFSALGELLEAMITHVDVTERKHAEQALQRSQFYLNEGQRIARIGSWAFNPSGFFDHWSQELFQIYGLDPQKGAPTLEQYLATIHPLDRDSMAETIRRMHAERCGCDVKKRIVRPDGELRYIRCVGIPVIEDEVLQGFRGTAMDITEQELMTQELRESEGKFRDYAETASDWFWEIGPDYNFTLLTENAFGSDPANRIGTACWDHALDLETEPEKWRRVRATLDSREPFRDFVYCSRGGDGSPMYVRASGKPVFNTNGEFRGYRGTATDVTAIIRAQEALRKSERDSRSAIDGIAGLVAITAPNGELETANRQVFEYFGRSLEWLKNWERNDAMHPEDLPRVLEFIKRAVASGIPFNHEVRLRRFDGEYRWFDNRGVPIRDDSGRITRWYVLLTDIEDRTRALARLEQMQSDFAHMNRVSMMGELAASLSHEITQPIASARNNARAAQNFLDMQSPDLAEVREALSCVVGDTDRAGDIVDRIRDHIKKAPPRKDQFDLNAAINEVLVLARNTITNNGVSVRTRLADGLFPVRGDRVQLQQVVLNLILNAVEAMGSVEAAPRELLISTEQDHTGVLVVVRDSGPGIDPTHLERVFEAFYTTKSRGVGMGLSICRSIIDAHGGRLWVEANEPRGTIFQFTLPAVQVGA
jgi:PAS domain S-box-containing protein